MKIAVLTLSLYANYGGNLQAYALLKVLRELGHDAWFLNRERHKTPWWKIPYVLAKRILMKYALGRKINLRSGLFDQRERAIVAQYSRKFIDKYIQPQTEEFLSTGQLTRGFSSLGFDAVIVGSDQVWRRRFVKANLIDYFCGFLPSSDTRTRRISYAASFGTSDWEYSPAETHRCGELIKRFHSISVRESDGVNLCLANFGVTAEHVVDPTLLLKASDYEQLIPQPEKKLEGILVYILDISAAKQNLVARVVTHLGLPTFNVNGNAASKSELASERVAPPVEDWLRGFRDAKFVITDSFHGTVFSILFNKPFIAIGNKTRGMSRFSSLLEMFNLSERLVTSESEIDEKVFLKPDWAVVNQQLEIQRRIGKDFLRRALAV